MDFLNNGGTIIQHVYESGAEIMLSGDKIRVQPVSILPEKLRCLLQKNREDVVQALKYYPVTLLIEAHRRACFDYGYDIDESVLINLIPPSGWKHLSECDEYDLEPLARELALRSVLHCGIIPRDWNRVLNCSHCGWVFSPVALECASCPWCEARKAGVDFPTPGVNRCANPETVDGVVVQQCEIESNNIDVIIHECHFCGERHKHGTGGVEWEKHVWLINGIRTLHHRNPHCIRKGIEITLADGTVVCNERGYYLGIGDQVPW